MQIAATASRHSSHAPRDGVFTVSALARPWMAGGLGSAAWLANGLKRTYAWRFEEFSP